MCFTSTSALSDEVCSGSFPCRLIKLLGHKPFRGRRPRTIICICEAKNSLCLLSAKGQGVGLPEGGEHNSSNRNGKCPSTAQSMNPTAPPLGKQAG